MRTFHIGGTASRVAEQTSLEAKNAGTIKFHALQTVRNQEGFLVAMNRNGVLVIMDEKGREKERYTIVYGAKLKVNEGDHGQTRRDAGRMGSLHVRDPHGSQRNDPVQGSA